MRSADRLFTAAEGLATAVPEWSLRVAALSNVARAAAATDPDRAERIATSIPGKYGQAAALSGIAKALAATSS